jgi:hypothetical protein
MIPKGATHYAKYNGKTYYFFKSNYGYRLIVGNMIQFEESNIDEHIKPL